MSEKTRTPATEEMLASMDKYWRAANYLSACQLYLLDNPLLEKPLSEDDIKKKIVGHWGTVPGQNFIYTHLNRVIKEFDLDMIYISGPGHGGNAMVAQDWLDGLLKVWTDGEKESDEIVSHWTESFKSLTASTREELQALKDTADQAGYTGVSEQLAADMETLDSLDAEIEALLKKRQNGYFSEADQIRLQELIDTREAIEIKYNLTPADTDGFEGIAQKVEAEVARAQARGQSGADVSVYENAVKAAAEGMAAVNAELDAQYDKEYAVIQLIEDSAERQSALDALNAHYNENRLAAAREYAKTLAGVVMPVWGSDGIQQANQQVDTLLTKLREYSMAGEGEKPAILQDLADLSAEMDEGALTEYLGLLTQIQSLLGSGMSRRYSLCSRTSTCPAS